MCSHPDQNPPNNAMKKLRPHKWHSWDWSPALWNSHFMVFPNLSWNQEDQGPLLWRKKKCLARKGLKWLQSFRSGMPKALSPGSREKTCKLVLHKAASMSTKQANSATKPSFRWVTQENEPLKENKFQEVIQSSQETTKWIKEASYTRAPFSSPWESFLTIHGERENCAQHHTLYSLAVSPVKTFRILPLANSLKSWSKKKFKV